MKKIVFKYGLIAGSIFALMFLIVWVWFRDSIPFEDNIYWGYATMVPAFLFIYFGMVAYRNQAGNGAISFGKAMKVGLLIVLVASVCYAVSWVIIQRTLIPDFCDKYGACQIKQLEKKGASPAEIKKSMEGVKQIRDLYSNPFLEAVVTICEPLPLGILMSLICAFIVRRKKLPPPAAQ